DEFGVRGRLGAAVPAAQTPARARGIQLEESTTRRAEGPCRLGPDDSVSGRRSVEGWNLTTGLGGRPRSPDKASSDEARVGPWRRHARNPRSNRTRGLVLLGRTALI